MSYEYQLVTTQKTIVITTSRIIPSTLSVRTCAASFPRSSHDDVAHVFLKRSTPTKGGEEKRRVLVGEFSRFHCSCP